jgi:hypothetical protein
MSVENLRPYVPNSYPSIPGGEPVFITEELDKLAATTNNLVEIVTGVDEDRIAGDETLQTNLDMVEATLSTDIVAVSAAVTAEQTARVSADEALATSIETVEADLTSDIATVSASVVTEATARATADTALATSITALDAELTTEIGTVSAAVTSEATARASADSALASDIDTVEANLTTETTNRTNADTTLQTNITTVSAAVTSEATARASADSALASDIDTVEANLTTETTNRTNADTTLQTNITTVSAAVTTEATARATADTALATKITTVSAKTSKRRLFRQTTGPTIEEIAPPGINRLSRVQPLVAVDWNGPTNSGLTNTITLQATGANALEGEGSLRARLTGTPSAGTTFGIDWDNNATVLDGAMPVTVGQIYEASAYVGHDAGVTAVVAVIYWYDAAGASLSENTGSNASGASGGTALSGYNRASVIATAPSSAAYVSMGLRATAAAVADPTLRVTRPFFGRALTGQTDPSEWTTGLSDVLWMDTDDNNKMYSWDGNSWIATDDSRIAANSAAITTEATARASADSALASDITTLDATVDGHTSSISTLNTVTADIEGHLEAFASVTLNVDGYVSGYQLYNGGPGSSSFAISADKFSIADPDDVGSPLTVFEYGSGVITITSDVEIDGDLLITGTVDTNQLANEAATALFAATAATDTDVNSTDTIVSVVCDIVEGNALITFDAIGDITRTSGSGSITLEFYVDGVATGEDRTFTAYPIFDGVTTRARIRYPLTMQRVLTLSPGSRTVSVVMTGSSYNSDTCEIETPTIAVLECRR